MEFGLSSLWRGKLVGSLSHQPWTQPHPTCVMFTDQWFPLDLGPQVANPYGYVAEGPEPIQLRRIFF